MVAYLVVTRLKLLSVANQLAEGKPNTPVYFLTSLPRVHSSVMLQDMA